MAHFPLPINSSTTYPSVRPSDRPSVRPAPTPSPTPNPYPYPWPKSPRLPCGRRIVERLRRVPRVPRLGYAHPTASASRSVARTPHSCRIPRQVVDRPDWEIEAKDGLPSADRNNKATLLLTGPFRTTKSSAKDSSPRASKLQFANHRQALRAWRTIRPLRH